MEKIVWYVVGVAAAICILLTVLACRFWGTDGNSFWANFILNVVAEFVGMGLAATAGAIIAISVTKKKLIRAIDSITRLRTDGIITPNTARTAVVFTVGIISPDSLKHARSSNGQASKECRVCALPAATAPEPPQRCKYCGLADRFWKLPLAEQGTGKI